MLLTLSQWGPGLEAVAPEAAEAAEEERTAARGGGGGANWGGGGGVKGVAGVGPVQAGAGVPATVWEYSKLYSSG